MTKIFSHRGAFSDTIRENNKEAFKLAIDLKADGIETDVQMSKEKELFLWHDKTLSKNGFITQRVSSMESNKLEQKGMVRLQDYAKIFGDQCSHHLEIKTFHWESEEHIRTKAKLTGEIASTMDNVYISCNNYMTLQIIRKLYPDLLLYLDIEDDFRSFQLIMGGNFDIDGISIGIVSLNKSIMEYARHKNKQVVVYTCNTKEHIQKALDLKVDVIITDDVKQAIQMREDK